MTLEHFQKAELIILPSLSKSPGPLSLTHWHITCNIPQGVASASCSVSFITLGVTVAGSKPHAAFWGPYSLQVLGIAKCMTAGLEPALPLHQLPKPHFTFLKILHLNLFSNSTEIRTALRGHHLGFKPTLSLFAGRQNYLGHREHRGGDEDRLLRTLCSRLTATSSSMSAWEEVH